MAVALVAGAAADRVVQPTWSGELVSIQGRTVHVRDLNGHVWAGQLTSNFQVNWQGRKLPLSALKPGQRMMFRLVGDLNVSPRQVDLIADLPSSPQYIAPGAPVPEYTRKGTWAGPSGVGGEPDNGPTLGKLPNTGAYSVHGGFPHQNQNNKVP